MATITRVSQQRRERILSVPRAALRFALGYLILPFGAGGSVDHRRGPIVLCLNGAQGDRRTHGVASLYPGLSHFAPLGRGDIGGSLNQIAIRLSQK